MHLLLQYQFSYSYVDFTSLIGTTNLYFAKLFLWEPYNKLNEMQPALATNIWQTLSTCIPLTTYWKKTEVVDKDPVR